jgi:hypothetical protein
MNNRYHVSGIVLFRTGVIVGVIIVSMLIIFYGYKTTTMIWNIPPLSPCFADMRVITSGAESKSLGYDPLVKNPRDPWGWKMNYPRAWQMFSAGINQSYTMYFGIAVTILFLVGIFLYVPNTISEAAAFILLLSIFSPAVLLGMERGNTDLLMFFMLSVAIICINKGHTIAKVIATASVLAAFILKLFPIFGIGLLLHEKKQTVIRLSLFVLSFVIVYAIASYNELILILQATPISRVESYGFDVLWMNMYAYSHIFGKIIRVLSYIVVLICFAIVPYWACKIKFGNTESNEGDKKSIDAFRVGSGIYVGTFLFGSTNWDYRLIFLLFVIPQLMLWSESSSKCISIISRLTIVGTVFSLWGYMIIPTLNTFCFRTCGYLLDALLDWVIFFGLFFLFSYSLPTWTRGFTTFGHQAIPTPTTH